MKTSRYLLAFLAFATTAQVSTAATIYWRGDGTGATTEWTATNVWGPSFDDDTGDTTYTAGDTVRFGGPVDGAFGTQTVNVTGTLSPGQIFFDDTNPVARPTFTFTGDTINLVNSGTAITANFTSANGTNVTFQNQLAISGNTTIEVIGGGGARSLKLEGAISGTGDLIVNGATGSFPRVNFANTSNNTFDGDLRINSGYHQATQKRLVPLGKSVIIGDGVGAAGSAEIDLLNPQGIGDSGTVKVTVNSDGRLKTHGFVRMSTLTLDGGKVTIANNNNSMSMSNAQGMVVTADSLIEASGSNIYIRSEFGSDTKWTISAGVTLNNEVEVRNDGTQKTIVLDGAGTYLANKAGATASLFRVENGTFKQGVANVFNNASVVKPELQLAGGTFDLNSFDATLDTALKLTLDSTINFGGSSTMWFGATDTTTWTDGQILTLTGFVVGTNNLRFGTTSAGLSGDLLNDISLAGYNATSVDSSGFVQFTVIPEPSSALLLLGAVGAIVLIRRRRA